MQKHLTSWIDFLRGEKNGTENFFSAFFSLALLARLNLLLYTHFRSIKHLRILETCSQKAHNFMSKVALKITFSQKAQIFVTKTAQKITMKI